MKRILLAMLFALALSAVSSLACCAELTADQINALVQKAVAGNTRALSTLSQSAAQGDSWAQLKLATMYYAGKGVPQSYDEALKWYRKAADQGDPISQDILSSMYATGKGVPQDFTEAAKWSRKAADLGLASAQYNLGIMYIEGQGVPQDFAEAANWYRKAADQGHANAQYNLGIMFMKGQGVPQDFVEATKWSRKAADQGHANAQYNLGTMYDQGRGVPQDYAAAVQWYRKAADQGLALGQFNLGASYTEGQGVPQNYAEAVKWYRKAAEQGLALGQFNLGVVYTKGQGVPQDNVQAYKWMVLSKATSNPGSDAYINASKGMDILAKGMTPAQIARAQQEASVWAPTDGISDLPKQPQQKNTVTYKSQQSQGLSESVRSTLMSAVAKANKSVPRSSFKDPQEAKAWLGSMSQRLLHALPDAEKRQDLLVTVHYEATRAGLDPQMVLSLIQVGSNFDKYAVSSTSARGYMQVMPFWVKLIGTPDNNLFQTRTNLRYGCTILRHYLDLEQGNLFRALGRYNGSLGQAEYPNMIMRAWKQNWAWDYARVPAAK